MYFLIVLNTVYTINMHVSSHYSSLPFYSAYLTLSSSNLINYPLDCAAELPPPPPPSSLLCWRNMSME